MTTEPILTMSDVSKRFGGLLAVNNLSLTIRKEQICGLIGPNGAGKTTVFNLITGVHTCTTGSIASEGMELTRLKPYAITRAGLARTYQTIRLFKSMTVWEHVLVGQNCLTGSSRKREHPLGRSRQKGLNDEAKGILNLLGLWEMRDRNASNLAYGTQRKVEIARALATRPKLVLLDEPTAGLNNQETGRLLKTLHKIHELGVTLLIIEHDMKVIMEFCDHIFVLNFGQKIAEGTAAQIRTNDQVIESYLGREK
jgi:branched-chain amino acid transport system ATP-binding protein